MEKNTPIKVLNRDSGSVVYSIPEMNGLRRVFQSGEMKEVTFEEIQKLSYIPGGTELLRDSLVILNPEAVDALVGRVEPEYNYTRKDIINLMQNGSLDEFLDCLDFAPEGVNDLIKELAVELPLNDVAKREAMLKQIGFNVDAAINIKKEAETPEKGEVVPEAPPTERRAGDSSQVRRVKTISQKES